MATIGGPDPSRQSLTPKISSHVDWSEACAAYEEAIGNPKERHVEVGILFPNGKVDCAQLGKKEKYRAHRVGSVTKTFTVFLALKLVKNGVLSKGLETRCGDLLSDEILGEAFEDPEAARNMTLEQLLSHTSGLEYDGHCRKQDPKMPLPSLHARFLKEGVEGRKYKHISRPGDGIGFYSNAGFAVAGWMLEVAYNKHYSDSQSFSQIMGAVLFEGVFKLSESSIAPGPTGDVIQSPAGDMTSSVDDLLKVAICLQKGEASLENVFGAGWQSTMLQPRDLFQHHGLGCTANASSIEHAGLNREKFGNEYRDVTALTIFPLRPGEAGLVAMCDSSALGPKPQEQRFTRALKTSAGIAQGDRMTEPHYDLDFYCPTSENAFLLRGNAYLLTNVDPFAQDPPDIIVCSRNGMQHVLNRDPSIDKKGIHGYRDKNQRSWMVISREDGWKAIYSDYCLVTERVEVGDLALAQPSLAVVKSLLGVYKDAEDPNANPTYTFSERNGHLYMREDNESYPCLYIPDDAGGTWVPSDPAGCAIKFRFPKNPDQDFLEITDIFTDVPQLPDKSIRIR